MGFITEKKHHLGKYVWNFFQPRIKQIQVSQNMAILGIVFFHVVYCWLRLKTIRFPIVLPRTPFYFHSDVFMEVQGFHTGHPKQAGNKALFRIVNHHDLLLLSSEGLYFQHFGVKSLDFRDVSFC